MLVVKRRPGEIIKIDLAEGIEALTLASDLFARCPIEIMVAGIRGTQVKLGIQADPRLRILREEVWLPVSWDRRSP